MAMLTLRISDELNKRLTAMAMKTGRTKTYFVKKLLEDGLEDFEDEILFAKMYREFIAEGGRGTKPSIPLENLKAYFAKEDLEDHAAQKRSETAPKTGSTRKKRN